MAYQPIQGQVYITPAPVMISTPVTYISDNTLTKCGKVLGIGCAIVCGIVIIILLSFGGYMVRKTNKQTKDTTKVLANITSVSNCISRSVTTSRKNAFGIRVYNTSIIYNCNVGVKYTFNNKEYAGNLTTETTDMQYSVGSNINIYVKNNEPYRFYFSQEVNKNRSSGTSCLVIGSILLVLTIVHIVLLKTSTTYKQLVCIDNLPNWYWW